MQDYLINRKVFQRWYCLNCSIVHDCSGNFLLGLLALMWPADLHVISFQLQGSDLTTCQILKLFANRELHEDTSVRICEKGP